MLDTYTAAARRGHPTASCAHRLMANHDAVRPESLADVDGLHQKLLAHIIDIGKKPTTLKSIPFELPPREGGKRLQAAYEEYKFYKVPDGIISYAQELACDELFDPDPLEFKGNAVTERGEQLEPECVSRLIERYGIPFQYTDDQQLHIQYGDLGATPDGLAIDKSTDLVYSGCEAKARMAPDHLNQRFITGNVSCANRDWHRYLQSQTCIYCCDAEDWYIGSINTYARDERLVFYSAKLHRDEKIISKIVERAALCMEIKNNYLRDIERFLDEQEIEIAKLKQIKQKKQPATIAPKSAPTPTVPTGAQEIAI